MRASEKNILSKITDPEDPGVAGDIEHQQDDCHCDEDHRRQKVVVKLAQNLESKRNGTSLRLAARSQQISMPSHKSRFLKT